MKRVFITLCVVLVFITACNTQKRPASSTADPSVQKRPASSTAGPSVQKVPFSLSIVPESSRGEGFGSSIEMAHDKPRDFYVVLTNLSGEPEAVWEDWNSWGYQTVSFELTTVDGKKFLVSRRPEIFTANFPSTFLIEPGEHQVYAIRLDEWWETHPSLPKTDEMAIKLKAIYEVHPTPEAAQYKVWIGRLESRTYDFKLRQ